MSDYTTIPLTQHQVAIVDNEYSWLTQWKWHVKESHVTFYARRNSPRPNSSAIYMHVVIMEKFLGRRLEHGEEVDHINNNGCDNRLENLRLASRTQNGRNRRKQINNTSGYKGVSLDRRRQKWGARIKVNNLYKFLGYFSTPEEAYAAYCAAAIEYHGEFANVS